MLSEFRDFMDLLYVHKVLLKNMIVTHFKKK